MKDLQKNFGDKLLGVEELRHQILIKVPESELINVLRFCKDSQAYQMDMLLDIVAVDYKGETPRFELVYILFSTKTKKRMRIILRVPEDKPFVDSACELYKSANWAEREVYDMMGVKFIGHPNLHRILMFDSFEGHPLRKDYQINKRQPVPETIKVPH